MGVQAVVGEAIKMMLDDHVPAVVRASGQRIGVNHRSTGDRMDDIFWLPGRASVEGPDIDSLVKSGVDDFRSDASWVPDETVLAAFPGLTDLAFEITLNVLIEPGEISGQKAVVLRWQYQFRRFCVGHCTC